MIYHDFRKKKYKIGSIFLHKIKTRFLGLLIAQKIQKKYLDNFWKKYFVSIGIFLYIFIKFI